jgi:hypothetical protein
MPRPLPAAVATAALVASIALANWLTGHYGLVPAGFGLLVTAGTYSAGLALALRDLLHESGGIRWVLGTIAAGCVLSLLLADGRIALASAAAFGLAELLDLAVYAPLRRRHWHTAVAASNAVGAVVVWVTALFLAVPRRSAVGYTPAGGGSVNLTVPCDSTVVSCVTWPLVHRARTATKPTTAGSNRVGQRPSLLNSTPSTPGWPRSHRIVISHEDLTADIQEHLAALPGIDRRAGHHAVGQPLEQR